MPLFALAVQPSVDVAFTSFFTLFLGFSSCTYILWCTLESCDILFFCCRPCPAQLPTAAPVHLLFEKRRWACRQMSSPMLSVTSYLESYLHTHSNYPIWWETWLLRCSSGSRAQRFQPLAGRCEARLPLLITAGDTWLIMVLCCCNGDRPGCQGDWEEQTLMEKRVME